VTGAAIAWIPVVVPAGADAVLRHPEKGEAMRVDGYTKGILTVIAIALSVLASVQVVRLMAPAEAIAAGKSVPQKVAICSEGGDFCASVDETGRLYVK